MLNRTVRTAWILAALMCASSVVAVVARPNAKVASAQESVDLETMIPRQFDTWRESAVRAMVVNPETQATLDRLYDQVLNRVYVSQDGYAIMLSIAYGSEQRGRLNLHRPESCYPAQGFVVKTIEPTGLQTSFGEIPIRRLRTAKGPRWEPLTYWVAIAGNAERSRFQRRMLDVTLGLSGKVPDGMLVRISSVDRDDARAFARQAEFAEQLLAAMNPDDRKRVSGLAPRAEKTAVR